MDEALIAKLAAQIYQSRRESGLLCKERDLVKGLVETGYLKPATRGFVGPITNKALLRHSSYPTFEGLVG